MSVSCRCKKRHVVEKQAVLSCRGDFRFSCISEVVWNTGVGLEIPGRNLRKMANFKYDIVTLIELVEFKPCIWDKTHENNKNKILRDKSWQEIFQYLEYGYEELSQAEKKKTGDMIMAKWTNIRDSFLRSLRTKSGQGAKKSYIYSEHLQFLLKVAQKDETESNFSQVQTEDLRTEAEELTDSQMLTESSHSLTILQTQPTPSTSRSTSSEHRPKLKRQLDEIEREILSELKKGTQADEPCSVNASHLQHSRSDQEIFLMSFIPYIRDMTETELMDFQMEVLTTIKNIKQRRILNSRPFQQQPISPSQLQYNIPQTSPAMSHSDSYQSSLQGFDYQSPPPSNMEQQQQEHSQQFYRGINKYQQLYNDTAE